MEFVKRCDETSQEGRIGGNLLDGLADTTARHGWGLRARVVKRERERSTEKKEKGEGCEKGRGEEAGLFGDFEK